MANIVIGIIAGAFGAGYMMYGRRQTRLAPVIAGLLLCVYPYFVDGWVWLCLIGLVLLVVPFLVDF